MRIWKLTKASLALCRTRHKIYNDENSINDEQNLSENSYWHNATLLLALQNYELMLWTTISDTFGHILTDYILQIR